MKRNLWKNSKVPGLLIILAAIFLLTGIIFYRPYRAMTLIIANQIDGERYLTVNVHSGDQLEFGWEHSFEHVTWNEFYDIREDGSLKLHTIAVGGFGAGIPAEMDCTYRYEDDLIYMENLENSDFDKLTWIHSQTQVKFIFLNGELLVTGEDLPQREKLKLEVIP